MLLARSQLATAAYRQDKNTKRKAKTKQLQQQSPLSRSHTNSGSNSGSNTPNDHARQRIAVSPSRPVDQVLTRSSSEMPSLPNAQQQQQTSSDGSAAPVTITSPRSRSSSFPQEVAAPLTTLPPLHNAQLLWPPLSTVGISRSQPTSPSPAHRKSSSSLIMESLGVSGSPPQLLSRSPQRSAVVPASSSKRVRELLPPASVHWNEETLKKKEESNELRRKANEIAMQETHHVDLEHRLRALEPKLEAIRIAERNGATAALSHSNPASVRRSQLMRDRALANGVDFDQLTSDPSRKRNPVQLHFPTAAAHASSEHNPSSPFSFSSSSSTTSNTLVTWLPWIVVCTGVAVSATAFGWHMYTRYQREKKRVLR